MVLLEESRCQKSTLKGLEEEAGIHLHRSVLLRNLLSSLIVQSDGLEGAVEMLHLQSNSSQKLSKDTAGVVEMLHLQNNSNQKLSKDTAGVVEILQSKKHMDLNLLPSPNLAEEEEEEAFHKTRFRYFTNPTSQKTLKSRRDLSKASQT